MILQELKNYYDRKAADPESMIPPEGWDWEEISFAIIIDENGTFLRFEDMREPEVKVQKPRRKRDKRNILEEFNESEVEEIKYRGKKILVPCGVERTSNKDANLLWDNADYILGNMNKDFICRITDELPDTTRRNAILTFLFNIDTSVFEKSTLWKDIYDSKSKNLNMSFRFDGDTQLYCETEEVKQHISCKMSADDNYSLTLLTRDKDRINYGICLITGEKDIISPKHKAIKGVKGTKTARGYIVSFNHPAFYSLGKKDAANAPVGKTAMFAYTTALKNLLDKDSPLRLQEPIGDASVIFWSDCPTNFEKDFHLVSDPEKYTDKIKSLLQSPNTGEYLEDNGTEKFFILGLSPNASRLSVRFWWKGTVGEIANNIKNHFKNLEIYKPEWEPPYYSIWQLLVNVAVQNKSKNIPTNIASDFMLSIITGTPYPTSLLQAALRRIKSDAANRVTPVRAALIKAYLNRLLSTNNNYDEKEKLQVGLDTAQQSIGYQIGRLFAVLEKIQEEASPDRKLNTTIGKSYYGSACTTPILVFSTLMRLNKHHLKKLKELDKDWALGLATKRERLISEIISHFDEFPPHLNLYEQGKFAIGYYHQRQDLFTKKDTPTTDAEN